MHSNDLILCKKLDSVMKYVDDIYLAPRDYCGYILLMNSGKSESQNNCKSIMAVVNDALRIIIYAVKVIKKDE
jgi:hypothetical protein